MEILKNIVAIGDFFMAGITVWFLYKAKKVDVEGYVGFGFMIMLFAFSAVLIMRR